MFSFDMFSFEQTEDYDDLSYKDLEAYDKAQKSSMRMGNSKTGVVRSARILAGTTSIN